MSNFLRRTPCAAVNRGHRTLPPSHQREGRKARTRRARGSDRNEDPHRDSGRGTGPATGSAGSESRSGRGGRRLSASAEGLLVLIPSRGPHLIFRFDPGLAGAGAGTESRPACRDGPGPGSPTVRRRWAGHPRQRRSAGAATVREALGAHTTGRLSHSPTDQRLAACEVGAELEGRPTPRLRSRRRPGDGGGGVRRTVRSRWASPFPPQSRGPLDAHTIKRPSPFAALLLHCLAPCFVATVAGASHHRARPGPAAATRRALRSTLFTCLTRP